jgi:hypothetical protein
MGHKHRLLLSLEEAGILRTKSVWIISVISLLVFAGTPSGQAIDLKVDVGCPGSAVKPGWTAFNGSACSGSTAPLTVSNLGGSGINVTVTVGNTSDNAYRSSSSYSGDEMGRDYVSADNGASQSECAMTMTLSNLPAGTYALTSYHNLSDTDATPATVDITVGGPGIVDTLISATGVVQSVLSSNVSFEDIGKGVVEFVANGSNDVVITFTPRTQGHKWRVYLNGFELLLKDTRIRFASETSGNLESVSPALIEVVVNNAEGGATYTVDYAVTGGTAIAAAIDYFLDGFCACDLDEDGLVGGRDIALLVEKWLVEITYDSADLTHDNSVNADDFAVCARQWLDNCGGNTIIFEPGDTSEIIAIEIIDDGLDEEDETIELALSNPTSAQLGQYNHTYYILDPVPRVSFESPDSSGSEGSTTVNIPVTLTLGTRTVTVDYAVTGGTATRGVDYTVADGTLTFNTGVTTRNITINVTDDATTEAVETIVLTLSNPTDAKLGQITQHEYTILDDSGVSWDEKLWYYFANPNVRLFVNGQGQLEWTPEVGGQFITRIPAQRFSQPGDVMELQYLLMTDGKTDCPPGSCLICDGRCPLDITCLSGTSDFRIGLFEADGQYITSNGFEVRNPLFIGYRGYQFRFSPNLDPATPYRWIECPGEENEEVHKTGNFAVNPEDSDNLLTINEGLMENDYIGGFGLPPGQFSLFTVRIERFDSDTVGLTISLNGQTYTAVDDSATGQPQSIDCIAVHMRNPRPYTRFVLDSVD